LEETLKNEKESQLYFAKKLHDATWELMELPNRTPEDDALLIHTAHASCYHWLQVGMGVNHQRAIWLLARTYTVLEKTELALEYAERCMELTVEYEEEIEKFDVAYGWESLARASALANDKSSTKRFRKEAEKSARAIKNKEDREWFLQDLHGGNWHGLY
jgi:hypothetical protein